MSRSCRASRSDAMKERASAPVFTTWTS
jgi:hypothetical protein